MWAVILEAVADVSSGMLSVAVLLKVLPATADSTSCLYLTAAVSSTYQGEQLRIVLNFAVGLVLCLRVAPDVKPDVKKCQSAEVSVSSLGLRRETRL